MIERRIKGLTDKQSQSQGPGVQYKENVCENNNEEASDNVGLSSHVIRIFFFCQDLLSPIAARVDVGGVLRGTELFRWTTSFFVFRGGVFEDLYTLRQK